MFTGFFRLFEDLRHAGGAPSQDIENDPPKAEAHPVPPSIDGYEITGFIGEGGMGQVWKAPANVLVDHSGWVRVCDFGIAKTVNVAPLAWQEEIKETALRLEQSSRKRQPG